MAAPASSVIIIMIESRAICGFVPGWLSELDTFRLFWRFLMTHFSLTNRMLLLALGPHLLFWDCASPFRTSSLDCVQALLCVPDLRCWPVRLFAGVTPYDRDVTVPGAWPRAHDA